MSEASCPVNLKFCLDAEYIQSALSLGFIEGAATYNELSDARLRAYREKKAMSSKSTATLSTLDKLGKEQLWMNMSDRSAISRLQQLLIGYETLLRQSGLLRILDTNQKVAVFHVLSAIRPWHCKEESGTI